VLIDCSGNDVASARVEYESIEYAKTLSYKVFVGSRTLLVEIETAAILLCIKCTSGYIPCRRNVEMRFIGSQVIENLDITMSYEDTGCCW